MTLYSLPQTMTQSASALFENEQSFDIVATALKRVYTAETHQIALQAGLEEVVRLSGARRGVLLIRPRHDNDLYPLFTHGGGLTHSYKYNNEFGVLLSGWVLSWPQAEAAGWHSLPLSSFGDLVGAIYLDEVSYSEPLARQKQIAVETLTHQLGLVLALVIENSEVLQIAKERQVSLEMLAAAGQIGQRLNASTDLERTMADFTQSCRFLLDAEQCAVLTFDPEAETLEYLAVDGVNKAKVQAKAVGLNDSIAGWVARTGEAALILDVEDMDPRSETWLDLAPDLDIRQVVCVPLSIRGSVAGVVQVANKINGSFDELDLSLLQLLATNAAIALENAQRYTLQEAEVKQKAELYSIASHGLRSPLMSIITWIDWILETGVQNDLHRARLEDIRSQTFNLSRFVGEILDMSRIEVGNVRILLAPLAVVPFVKKSVAMFELRAPTHRFEVEVIGSIPPVRADETQLLIVLDHLLENAIKYSPVASVIKVKIEPVANNVQISVSDQGAGIPVDEIGNLFSRFYRGRQQSASGHSLGLGLYISKKLVQAQGGDMWVHSEIDRGSTFTFTLTRERIGD